MIDNYFISLVNLCDSNDQTGAESEAEPSDMRTAGHFAPAIVTRRDYSDAQSHLLSGIGWSL